MDSGREKEPRPGIPCRPQLRAQADGRRADADRRKMSIAKLKANQDERPQLNKSTDDRPITDAKEANGSRDGQGAYSRCSSGRRALARRASRSRSAVTGARVRPRRTRRCAPTRRIFAAIGPPTSVRCPVESFRNEAGRTKEPGLPARRGRPSSACHFRAIHRARLLEVLDPAQTTASLITTLACRRPERSALHRDGELHPEHPGRFSTAWKSSSSRVHEQKKR